MRFLARIGALVLVAACFWPSLAWALTRADVRDLTFTIAADSTITRKGASEKYLFHDNRGGTWLFKPMRPDEAAIEEGSRRLAELCGLSTPDVFSVRIASGPSGSLSRIIDAQGTLHGRPPEQLEPAQAARLLELFAFQWLIGNFDTHENNFLVQRDGNVVPIDFGLAFNDTGELFELKLEKGMPFRDMSYFFGLFKAYASRKLSLDFAGVFAFVDRIQAIPEPAFDAVLTPLAALRKQALGHTLRDRYGDVTLKSETEFDNFFAERRSALRNGLEKFFDRMSRARGEEGFTAPAEGHPSVPAMGPAPSVELTPVPIRLIGDMGKLAPWRRTLRNVTHFIGRIFAEPGVVMAGAEYHIRSHMELLEHWLLAH